MSSINIVELRDKLLEKQFKYKQELQNAEVAFEEVKKLMTSIESDDIAFLQSNNFDTSVLQTLELDRLKNDSIYLDEVSENLKKLVHDLHNTLMELVK